MPEMKDYLRTEYLQVRLTPGEKRLIDDASSRLSLSTSEYVRSVCGAVASEIFSLSSLKAMGKEQFEKELAQLEQGIGGSVITVLLSGLYGEYAEGLEEEVPF